MEFRTRRAEARLWRHIVFVRTLAGVWVMRGMRSRVIVLVALEQFLDCRVGRHIVVFKQVEYFQVAESLMVGALI